MEDLIFAREYWKHFILINSFNYLVWIYLFNFRKNFFEIETIIIVIPITHEEIEAQRV